MPRLTPRAYWMATGLLLTLSTLVGRNYFLDDTFIHLRYIRNWVQGDGLTYIPGEASMGSSAPGYLVLLAGLASVAPSSLWPAAVKALGVGCQLATAGLVWALARGTERAHAARPVAFAFSLLALTTLAASRWLQDGMETSVFVLLSVAAAWVADRHGASREPTRLALAAVLYAAPALLRIDGAPISLAAVLLALVSHGRRFLPAAIGGAFVTGVFYVGVYAVFGSVVPDSAAAKAGDSMSPAFVYHAAFSTSIAGPLWLAPVASLLWMAKRPGQRLTALVGLVPIALVLTAGVMRNQVIHGARYFLPSLGFALACVIVIESRSGMLLAAWHAQRLFRIAAGGLLFACLAFAVVTTPNFLRILAGQQIMVPDGVDVDRDTRILAFDIGRLGWTTDATILDGSGLVNGAEIAAARGWDERICALIGRYGQPDLLVLGAPEEQRFGAKPPWAELTLPCGTRRYRRSEAPVMTSDAFRRPRAHHLWTAVP